MPGLSKQNRRTLNKLKRQFNLGPGYADIIRDAVINDFSEQEIIQAITKSDTFRRQYPGIFDKNGDLQDFLTGVDQANLNRDTLATALTNYKALKASYEDVAVQYGGVLGKISRDKVAALIRNEVSPEELTAKARAIQLATEKKADLDIFNQQLKEAGMAPLQGKELFKFLAKTADQKFYDVYEATRLRQLAPGLNLSTADAAEIAGSLSNVNDLTGQQQGVDVGAFVQATLAEINDIGPDLQAAGIDRLRLQKYLANPGADPEVAQKIEQVRATKRGRGQYVAGQQPQQGPGGVRLGTPDDRAAAYG